MICMYDSYEKIKKPQQETGPVCYCTFDGEDMKIPEMLARYPQAQALVHLIMEGYLAAEVEQKSTYWRETTETIIEWMMKKGIVQSVSKE